MDEMEHKQVQLNVASKAKRLINYSVDTVCAFMALALISYIGETFLGLDGVDMTGTEITIERQLIFSAFVAFYYILMEGILKGKTPGKYITGTRAVTLEGNVPDLWTNITRSFYRIVPFNALSFLGPRSEGWHDRWSETMVIDEA